MKLEPLKNKLVNVKTFGWAGSKEATEKKYPYKMYLLKDVKSAVEWMIREDLKVFLQFKEGHINTLTMVQRIGNNRVKAFPDLQEIQIK